MGKSSLNFSFNMVIKILNSISNIIIKAPNEEESRQNSELFKKFSALSGVVGAIDGTYINIKAPQHYPERYINRKCFFAITLQAICNANLKFIDVFVGYPSSVSDKRIFINSDFYNNVLLGKYIFPNDYFIIGDKAYPILDWCLVPYIDRGNLTNQQKKINTTLAKSRQCIERAFALLKGRFRRLKYLDMSRTDLIPSVILACCVLHNICLNTDDLMLEHYIADAINDLHGDENIDFLGNDVLVNQIISGMVLRDNITSSL